MSPGTNGKGSTVAFMRADARSGGQARPRLHLAASGALQRAHPPRRRAGRRRAARRRARRAASAVNAGQSISVFEITTAAAFLLFSETPADYLLLEVGLGGRYDATNVIERPAATVITPVSIDHPEFLGATVEKIAYEKAGILQPRRAGDRRRAGASARCASSSARRCGSARRGVFAGARFLHPRRERPARVRGPARAARPAAAAAGRPPSVRQRRDCDRDAAGDRAGACRPIARSSAGSLEARMAGAAATAARRAAGRARAAAAPRSGSTAPTTKRAGACSPRRWRISRRHAPRPLALICGTLASKDTAGFLAHFKGLAREVIAVPIAGEHAAPLGRRGRRDRRERRPRRRRLRRASPRRSRFLAARDWPTPPRILIAGSLYLAGAVLEANDDAPR